MTLLLFDILSILAALYAAYLLTFRTYEWDGRKNKKGERMVFPRILYIITLLVVITPIVNIIATVFFLFYIPTANHDGFYVESWLFDKPNIRKKKNESKRDKVPSEGGKA